MTDEELSAIEARARSAPPGHEAIHPDDLPGRSIVACGRECRPPYDYTVVGVEGPARVAVAELYGHAQEDILALVEEVRRLREALAFEHSESAWLRAKLPPITDADREDFARWVGEMTGTT